MLIQDARAVNDLGDMSSPDKEEDRKKQVEQGAHRHQQQKNPYLLVQ